VFLICFIVPSPIFYIFIILLAQQPHRDIKHYVQPAATPTQAPPTYPTLEAATTALYQDHHGTGGYNGTSKQLSPKYNSLCKKVR
jgi:hypothetical protein